MKLFLPYLQKACLLVLAGMACIQVQAQSGFRERFRITQPAKLIAADKLRQLYIVTPGNEVIKYSADGQLLYRFNNNTLGPLEHIDATDPFNLLLYYPDFQVVLILDRTLNLLGEYNLWSFGISQPRTPCMANDNLLWIYDEAGFRLKKLDRQGHVITQSDDLNLLLGRQPSPSALLARNNRVYMNDPKSGIHVFDNFGQFQKTLSVTGAVRFWIPDDESLWFFRGVWECLDPATMLPRLESLPAGIIENEQALFFRERIFTLQNRDVVVWEK